MNCEQIFFSAHAVLRMIERGIGRDEIVSVIKTGKVIFSYPDDSPLPSVLKFGMAGNRPLHVVIALDKGSGKCHIITVYEPDPAKWDAGFKMRKIT